MSKTQELEQAWQLINQQNQLFEFLIAFCGMVLVVIGLFNLFWFNKELKDTKEELEKEYEKKLKDTKIELKKEYKKTLSKSMRKMKKYIDQNDDITNPEDKEKLLKLTENMNNKKDTE